MTDWTNHPLTINDMWSLKNSKENTNWGISGYESPKIYFDHKKIVQDREFAAMHNEVWVKKGHYPKIKLPVDKDGKEIIPSKKSFIEEHIKNVNSSFSKEKFDAYVEKLKERGKTLAEVEGIKPAKKEGETKENKKRTFKDRVTIIDEIINEEKKKLKYPPHVEELINKVKDKHARYTSPSGKKSPKVSTIIEDRVSFLCDAQYLAEKTPFYSKKMEAKESPNSKKEKEFFPEKLNVLPKSPQWKYPMPMDVKKEPFLRREEMYNEKISALKKSWESRKIKFIDDVALSYFKIKDGSKGTFKYSTASKMPEQYNTAKTLNPPKYPSPHEYFKTPVINPHNSPKKKKESENSPKINYADREKADKISTRPMKNYVF